MIEPSHRSRLLRQRGRSAAAAVTIVLTNVRREEGLRIAGLLNLTRGDVDTFVSTPPRRPQIRW